MKTNFSFSAANKILNIFEYLWTRFKLLIENIFSFFLLKRLKKQFCSIITLLVENFVFWKSQSSEKAQKKQHITFSIITLLVENSILLFLSSRTSRLCQEVNLWEFFGRNCPSICIIKDVNPREVHLALHFSPRTLNSEGGNPSTCLTVSFRFFVDFKFKALIVN